MATIAITLTDTHEKFTRNSELMQKVEKGLVELDAGQTVEFDLETFLDRMNADLDCQS